MKTRRKFSREFKLEAVKMVKERGVAARQVSRDLDINENMLRRWIKELSEDPHEAFPGLGNMKTEQAEIARLQRDDAKVKVQRDILKKSPWVQPLVQGQPPQPVHVPTGKLLV